MTGSNVDLGERWKEFGLALLRPWPLLSLAAVVGAGALAYCQSHTDGLNVTAPPVYVPTCSAQAPGALYCVALAKEAQGLSFTLQWLGWGLVLVGGLFGIAMALKEDGSSTPWISAKNRAVLMMAVGAGISALGSQVVARASDAAELGADVTAVLAELALQDVETTSTTEADAKAPGEQSSPGGRSGPGGSCEAHILLDRRAYRGCVSAKSRWLSGRGDSSILEQWHRDAVHPVVDAAEPAPEADAADDSGSE